MKHLCDLHHCRPPATTGQPLPVFPAWDRCTRIGATVANWGHSKGSGTVTHLPSVVHLPSESVSQPIYLLHLIGKKRKDIPWPEGNVPIKEQMMQ